MKRLSLTAILTLWLCALTTPLHAQDATPPKLPPGFTEFVSDDGLLSFYYPADWVIFTEDMPYAVAWVSSPDTYDNMPLLRQDDLTGTFNFLPIAFIEEYWSIQGTSIEEITAVMLEDWESSDLFSVSESFLVLAQDDLPMMRVHIAHDFPNLFSYFILFYYVAPQIICQFHVVGHPEGLQAYQSDIYKMVASVRFHGTPEELYDLLQQEFSP